jgi:hypothetical protein
VPEPKVADQPPEASASSEIEPPPPKPSALVALSERIVRWGAESDFVKLLELAGKFGLVIAAASYLVQIPAQRQAREDALKAKRYQAWALINSANGSATDGGRRDALQDLNDDRVDLAGVDLANAFLNSIKLPKAHLSRASLTHANLDHAVLTDAKVDQKQLDEACGSDATLPPRLTLKPCPPKSSP